MTTETLPAVRENGHPITITGPRYSVADVEAMAQHVARSRLFPGIADPQAAFTLMMLCQAEGLHPMQALKRYHIIEGRPSMRADAMQAEFQARGGWVRWVRYDAEQCEAVFGHPQHEPDGVTVKVSLAEMREAGITQGQGGTKANWKRFPAAMLRARAISAGVRMVDPGVVAGIYTPEEVADFEPPHPPPPIVDNQTGHGRGQFASPEQVEAYEFRLKKYIESLNSDFLDTMQDGKTGELPSGLKDPCNFWQMNNHLLKWALREGKLADVGTVKDPETDEEKPHVKSGQVSKYVAIVYHREPEAVRHEVMRYYNECAAKEKAKHRPEEASQASPDEDDEPFDETEAGTGG